MDNCFYTERDKTIFHVAGYCLLDNTVNVKEQIEILKNNYEFYKKLFNTNNIKTFQIQSSRKYKGCRVFYAENIEECKVPPSFHRLGGDWTFHRWLD